MSGSFISVTGNLTRDPELTSVGSSGNSLLKFGVAFAHSYRKADGNWEEETSFVNVVAWRRLAEDAHDVLKKGMNVVVTGRLEIQQFEREDGTKGQNTQIVADNIAPTVFGIDGVTRRPPKSSGNHSTATASSADDAEWPED